MNCQHCGYELWNLREARCPECGREFRVTDWRFEPNSVTLHCRRCHAQLAEPGLYNDATRCHTCGNVVNWDSVSVVPSGNPAATFASFKGTWEGLPAAVTTAGGLFVLSIPILFVVPLLLGYPIHPTVGGYLVMLAAVVLVAGTAISLTQRREKRIVRRIWGLVPILAAIGLVWLFAQHATRYSEWKWSQEHMRPLRLFATANATYIHDNGGAPEHPLQVMEYVQPEWFLAVGLHDDPGLAMIGCYTLEEWERGNIESEVILAHIERDLSQEAEWLLVGDFYFSRRVEAWLVHQQCGSSGNDLVLAVSRPHPRTGHRVALFRNGFVGRLLPAEVAAQSELGRSLGLDTLPTN